MYYIINGVFRIEPLLITSVILNVTLTVQYVMLVKKHNRVIDDVVSMLEDIKGRHCRPPKPLAQGKVRKQGLNN